MSLTNTACPRQEARGVALGGVLRVVVRWDPMLTSGNARMHHLSRYHKEQKAKAAARLAWIEAGRPQVEGPVRVSLLVRRARGMDLQNVWGGVKGAMDGLFTAAVTPDDSRRWIAELGGVRMEIGKQFKGKEEVVFIIEPLGQSNEI